MSRRFFVPALRRTLMAAALATLIIVVGTIIAISVELLVLHLRDRRETRT